MMMIEASVTTLGVRGISAEEKKKGCAEKIGGKGRF